MKFPLTFPSRKWQALGAALFLAAIGVITGVISMHPWDVQAEDDSASHLDRTLIRVLRDAGFTGNVEATLEARLGRRINPS